MADATVPTRTAVVTGASQGIGRAIAARLAGDGFRVWAVARRRDLSKSSGSRSWPTAFCRRRAISPMQTRCPISQRRLRVARRSWLHLCTAPAPSGTDRSPRPLLTS